MRKLALALLMGTFLASPALAGDIKPIDDIDIKPGDDIIIKPVRGVPEPTSALLMFAGMATVGMAIRRRR